MIEKMRSEGEENCMGASFTPKYCLKASNACAGKDSDTHRPTFSPHNFFPPIF